MQHLLNLKEHNGKTVVSARELYSFLGVRTEFAKWCERMFEYGFIENVDYSLVKIGERSAHNKIDYALTIECAKEISMLQRTDKGKEARLYFIECEKRLHGDPLIIKAMDRLQGRDAELANLLDKALNVIQFQDEKIKYINNVLKSTSIIPVTVIAKDLGMTASALNKELRSSLLIWKVGKTGTWVPYREYQHLNLTHTITHQYTDKTGQPKTRHVTGWSERGRQFIHQIIELNWWERQDFVQSHAARQLY